MRSLTLAAMTLLVCACDPWGFGFKENPAYVLEAAYESIGRQDLDAFVEVTGKEALCLYGNSQGLQFLKENISVGPSDISLKPPQLIISEHFSSPEFVGFWSYYHEKYLIEVSQKSTKKVLLDAFVDCHYGTKENKNPSYVNLDKMRYQTKQCRIVRLGPKSFSGLPMKERCQRYKMKS